MTAGETATTKECGMTIVTDEVSEDVDYLIEIRGVYDGWSVKRMKDGSYVNRWPEDDRRHKPTQGWIDARNALEQKHD